MNRISPLIDHLKRYLREAGKTYADVAQHLDLSEASVKRLFAQKNMTLERFDAICDLVDIDLIDLVKVADNTSRQLTELTHEQESEIVENPKLLLILWCLINHWTVDQILEVYDIKQTECIQLLAKLDRLKMIELQLGNRVRLRLAPTFNWIEDGPILHYFREQVDSQFFKSNFAEPTERLFCLNSMMSVSANLRFQERIQKLVNEFNEVCEQESQLPLSSRHGTTLVVAMRRWEYPPFLKYKRKITARSDNGPDSTPGQPSNRTPRSPGLNMGNDSIGRTAGHMSSTISSGKGNVNTNASDNAASGYVSPPSLTSPSRSPSARTRLSKQAPPGSSDCS